ncbi:head-tail connector protein [Pseudomonas sp. FP2338]|uniref:head-tail connector protein n=1 Tax=Pseudomonas sp. FP2338 TaxID=2954093 RepID=UPI0027335ADD|nr:head-tail connector protein [Pseudomonas sp. FP2338]WLH86027.1 head-tail connector protein [Pseudomonas sp. FP2338]
MSVIDIELAMKHLRAESEDQDLVQSQLDGAETAAMAYMNRSFFADQATLDAARLAAPTKRAIAVVDYDVSMLAAQAIEDAAQRLEAEADVRFIFAEALELIARTARGLVVNKAIEAACLLKLGHLYANREEVVTGTIATELPLTSKSLLAPYRIGMGV